MQSIPENSRPVLQLCEFDSGDECDYMDNVMRMVRTELY
jgi:hypothetical protein